MLAELSSGKDFVGVAATGSGKSTVWLVAAAAAVRDAMQSGDWSAAPRPLEALVLVPLASQGGPIEEEADDFLWKAAWATCPPTSTGGRACAPREPCMSTVAPTRRGLQVVHPRPACGPLRRSARGVTRFGGRASTGPRSTGGGGCATAVRKTCQTEPVAPRAKPATMTSA